MRAVAILIAVASAMAASASIAEPISRASLIQYQYGTDVKQCSVELSNGLKIEFDGLFAKEPENVVFHQIVNLGVKTDRQFQFSSMLRLEGPGSPHHVKVSRIEKGVVFFALDAAFLNELWGSEEPFRVRNLGASPYDQDTYLELPDDRGAARVALSRARTCYYDALNTD